MVSPAFGGELCRLRLEALTHDPPASLGSFFDLSRPGTVYALTPERGVAAARAPESIALYTYLLDEKTHSREVLDPYAVNSVANSSRGRITPLTRRCWGRASTPHPGHYFI